MRQITVTIYRFSELSEKAKEHAKYEYFKDEGYGHADEAMATLHALATHFHGKMTNWDIDWEGGSHSSATFNMPELSEKDIRAGLRELGTYNKRTGKGHGDCKLTGVCFDEDAIDGFRLAFRAGERDLVKLMEAAFRSWLKACQSDFEHEQSDEAFGEHCDANDWEFTEAGEFVIRSRK